MLLITSANGNQGKHLIPKLVAEGVSVRACVQTDVSAERLSAAGVHDVVIGDIGDPTVVARAVEGIEKVYHIGPFGHPREREVGCNLIDAAKSAGVGHFAFSSVLHAITTDLIQHEIKRDVEEHLLSSGLDFTILQPSNYMMPLKLRPVFEHGIFRLSWSLERRQSMVDLDDVTDVAVAVLKDSERHSGATYELVGPGRFTAHELGAIISRVVGREIPVEEIDAETYLKAFGATSCAVSEHQARVLRAISARYSSHDFVGNPNVLTWLLGRTPTTFEQFVEREYRAFRANSKVTLLSL
jgi:uncharacterized protein YbjT (DUF2867 family)